MASRVIASLDDVRTARTLRNVSVHVDSACIAWVLMDMDERSVNTVEQTFVEDMTEILSVVEKLIAERKVRVVVFYSVKKASFIVGADVHRIYPVTDANGVNAVCNPVAANAAKAAQRLFNRIQALRVPTLAAINGPCLGAGCELSLACTYRIATKAKFTQIGLPEVKLGLLPGAGGTVRLPRLIGLRAALGIILPGGAANAGKAKRMGLVDRVAEYEDRLDGENRFLHEARRYAGECVDRVRRPPRRMGAVDWVLDETRIGQRIVQHLALRGLQRLTKGKYPAPVAALDCVVNNLQSSIPHALEREARAFGNLVATPESKNLCALFFLTSEAKKRADRTGNAPFAKVHKCGVIGAGVMGAGIVQLLAYKDISVYVRDIKEDFVRAGLARVRKAFDVLVKSRRLTREEAAAKMARVSGGTSLDGFSDCDLVIEAAVERMDLKKRILKDTQEVAKPDCVFATNTSSLSLNELQAASSRPDLVVGMHFFNPVHKMPLVEVIKGKETSDSTAATVYQLALDLGKTPVLCRDGPGFIVNRILGIYMAEAGHLLIQGGDIASIDKAIVDFGLPMGPFRLMDEVGLDIAGHVGPILHAGLGDRFKPAFDFSRLNANPKRLGKKTGAGFYLYNAKGRSTGIDPLMIQLVASWKSSSRFVSRQEIVDRCVLLMVNEAAYILEEGIADRPEDVDLAMVFGTGFPPFRGGLLQYADHRGITNVVNRLKELEQYAGPRFRPAPLLVYMAQEGQVFFPQRPKVPYIERSSRLAAARL